MLKILIFIRHLFRAIELDVISAGRKIGSVQFVPDLETRQFLIEAGKRWEIIELNLKKEKMYVIPSKGVKTSHYSGGLVLIFTEGYERKCESSLTSNYIPEYLDENAKLILKEAQAAALEAGLATGSFVIDGPNTCTGLPGPDLQNTGPSIFLGKHSADWM